MIGDLPPKFWLPPKPAIVRAASLELTKLAMPIMGTFAAASVNALRPKSPSNTLAISELAEVSNSSDLTTYNFTSYSFGDADADRVLIVACYLHHTSSARTANSMTVGGTSATEVIEQATAGGSSASIWIVELPTGTSGTISVTASGACQSCGIRALRVVGLSSTTAHDTATDTADPLDLGIDVPANGLVVAVGGSFGGGGSYTHSEIDEITDAIIESNQVWTVGYRAYAAAQTGLAVQLDHSTGTGTHTGVAASFS